MKVPMDILKEISLQIQNNITHILYTSLLFLPALVFMVSRSHFAEHHIKLFL